MTVSKVNIKSVRLFSSIVLKLCVLQFHGLRQLDVCGLSGLIKL